MSTKYRVHFLEMTHNKTYISDNPNNHEDYFMEDIFGAYPVAYWGYREAFCNNRIGIIERCEDEKGNIVDPWKAAVESMKKFSLVEKILSGFGNTFPDNHITIKMSNNLCLSFHDQKLFVGDDVNIMDMGIVDRDASGNPKVKEPLWRWDGSAWVHRDPNRR